MADGLDPTRLDGLVNIGVDEVSWRRHYHYLTLVADHTGKKIVWAPKARTTATLDAFFGGIGRRTRRAVAGGRHGPGRGVRRKRCATTREGPSPVSTRSTQSS